MVSITVTNILNGHFSWNDRIKTCKVGQEFCRIISIINKGHLLSLPTVNLAAAYSFVFEGDAPSLSFSMIPHIVATVKPASSPFMQGLSRPLPPNSTSVIHLAIKHLYSLSTTPELQMYWTVPCSYRVCRWFTLGLLLHAVDVSGCEACMDGLDEQTSLNKNACVLFGVCALPGRCV